MSTNHKQDLQECSTPQLENYSGDEIDHITIEPARLIWTREIRIALKNGKHLTLKPVLDVNSQSMVANIRVERGSWGRLT